jgi:hypothetical protein
VHATCSDPLISQAGNYRLSPLINLDIHPINR